MGKYKTQNMVRNPDFVKIKTSIAYLCIVRVNWQLFALINASFYLMSIIPNDLSQFLTPLRAKYSYIEVTRGQIRTVRENKKGPVPKTRKFKLYVHSEEFTSDRGSPKEHFDQKTRKKF